MSGALSLSQETIVSNYPDKFRLKQTVKRTLVPVRPLKSDLMLACSRVGRMELSDCQMSNAMMLKDMTDEMVNALSSEYPVPFGAYEDVQSMIARCENNFLDALTRADPQSEPYRIISSTKVEFDRKVKEARSEMRQAVRRALSRATKLRKLRSNALLFACPPLGLFGLHHFYLGHHGLGIISILTCWTLIVPLFNIVLFFQLLLVDEHHFDLQHNSDYLYFQRLSAVT